MKKSLTLIAIMVIVGFSLTFNTASVFAGNASNDKNNTNGHAYGHNKCKNKCKCNCELDVDLISIIVKQAVRDALDEAEADRLALASARVAVYGTTPEDVASPESITDIEWRRNMWHKISDDALYNPGYTGFDIIAYTKNAEAEAFVANSSEGVSNIDMILTNSNGEQLRLKGSMEMKEEAFSDRDYFLTK